MKKFKIIGFLIVVLFVGIFWGQEALTADCLSDDECTSNEHCSNNNICVECEQEYECWDKCDSKGQESLCLPNNKCECSECSEGFIFDKNKHSCVSICKTGEEWSQSLNQCQPKVGQTACPEGYTSSGALGTCIKVSTASSTGGGTTSGSTSGSKSTTASQVTGDQRCWTKTACIKYRTDTYSLDATEAEKGFYSADEHGDAKDACGLMRGEEMMGFCSVSSVASTEIKFGSVNTFLNFGDFIRYFYKYSFVIVSILAVLMFVVAGVQWLSSAGSQEKIGAAKKRIIGAVIGLIILALSYTVLNFINPYLVNFRLPQVWILNSSIYGTEFCRDLPGKEDTMFLKIANNGEKITSERIMVEYNKESFPLRYSNDASFTCGDQFIYNTSPDKTNICRGHFNNNQKMVCLNKGDGSYGAFTGVLSGTIKGAEENLFKQWEANPVDDDEIELYVVCNSGTRHEVSASSKIFEMTVNGEDRQASYIISAHQDSIENSAKKCGNITTEVAGFVICPEFGVKGSANDEAHWLGRESGKDTSSDSVDLGLYDDDSFFNTLTEDKKNFFIPSKYFLGNTGERFRLNIDINNLKSYN